MWTEVHFEVAREHAQAWSDALLAAGALSVQVDDADEGSPDEQPLFGEPGHEPEVQGWARTRLAAMIEASANADALLAAAAHDCGLPPPAHHSLHPVPDRDWVRATQSQFEPIEIGQRLLITPSWHLDPAIDGSEPAAAHGGSRSAPPSSTNERVRIVLDPGLAFGTGSHPTTQLCLQWLDEHLAPGARVIDYGCGSGILAIAAAKLGASQVTALDIDPQAEESARANALINAADIEVQGAVALPAGRADVVLANILANPLRMLAPILTALLAPGGTLVLAGLLQRQVDEIAACYPGLQMREWRTLEGWSCLVGTLHRPQGSIKSRSGEPGARA